VKSFSILQIIQITDQITGQVLISCLPIFEYAGRTTKGILRVPTDLENLENLEKSGNFTNLERSGKSQGISPKVRELFEAGLSSKANNPRLLKWTYAG